MAAASRLPEPPVVTERAAWTHVLTRAIGRMPGPAWLTEILIGLAIAVVMHLRLWTTGQLPFGTPALESTYWGAQATALLWTLAYVERLAASSFAAFRPALTLDDDGVERRRRELTRLPWRPTLVLLIVGVALTIVTFAAAPSSSKVDGTPAAVFGLVLVAQAFNVSMFFVLLYGLLHQAWVVRRTLATDISVDVFRPGPLHAITRLTARTGAAIVLLVASAVAIATFPDDPLELLLVVAPFVVLPPIVVTLAFLLPLQGTHERLSAEKARLADAAELRLKGLLEELDRDIDARKLSGLGPLRDAVRAVLDEREIVAKLPTWPWSVGTARGFISAILLPLALFLVQRFLAQVV